MLAQHTVDACLEKGVDMMMMVSMMALMMALIKILMTVTTTTPTRLACKETFASMAASPTTFKEGIALNHIDI